MPFLRKTIIFFVKFTLGIYFFYLFTAFVLIPLGLPWAIRNQGTKLLKHPVKVRAAFLNPFLLRFNINGLAILDNNKQVMVGFDRFWFDFSFIGLFQKKYRIESLGLNGLKVNVQLLEDGNINLLGLVPNNTVKPTKTKKAAGEYQSDKTAAQKSDTLVVAKEVKPLPNNVVVDLISMENGSISFTDKSIKPNFTTTLSGMSLRITGLSTSPDKEAKVSFQAKLDDKGTISTDTSIRPFASPLVFETVFKLDDYALQVLTPYVGKYTGNTVKDGKLSLSMNYRVANNQLNASHKLLVQSFDFGDKVDSKDSLNLPFGLALALLEDSQDRIDISLPMTGDISKPDFHYFHLVGQILRNFFFKIITKPFAFLGSIVGVESGSEELGYIRFLPGQTNLSDAEKEKLNIIVKALRERPKLLLEVKGSYDPLLDWRAIKADVFEKDFWVLRKDSRRLDSWVYQELYQRRFGIIALWKLTKSYRSKAGVYDDAKINEEIRRQLIEDGTANKVALSVLAEGRAKVIYDFIIAAGFDARRINIGEIQESQASDGFIPLQLVLTVFDNSSTSTMNPLFPTEVKK